MIASYAIGPVNNDGSRAGGLIGESITGSITEASYATGTVTVSDRSIYIGGLIGFAGSISVTHSYWDTERSGRSTSAGGTGKTTVQLQSPTSYTSTAGNTSAIYSAWNVDVDGVPGNDDPWTFGAPDQYPVLKYAGMDTTAQFAAQPLGVPQGVTVTALVESLDVRWTAVRNATGYKVQWKSGGQSYDTTNRQATVSVGSDTTHTIGDLMGGTLYTVRVIATKTGAPDGRPSAEQTGTPRSAPPGVPGNVMVTPYALALRVTWDTATNADGYKVQWKSGNQDYDAATREYAVGGTDTTIVGLTAGTSYTVRVLATREYADDGPASSEVMGTPLAIPSLSITSPDVTEGAAGATDTLRFVVTLSHASQSEVTVAYADARTGSATSGTDYTALAAGTLTIAAGGVLGDTLAVVVIGDGTDEPDETVDITLTSPTNAIFARNAGTLTGTGTITDDDAAVATLVLSPPAISENNGIATVTATLSSAENAAVTITVSAAPVQPAVPGDFSLSNTRTLTIAAGATTSTGSVTILTNDNQVSAATKSVTVSGTADDTPDVVAPPAPVTLRITDDESAQVTLVLSSASILENGEVATVTATLSSAENAETAITVSAAAVAPADTTDFTLSSVKTLTIAADSLTSTGVVTITAIDDTLDGLDKTVTVFGTAAGGNNATAPDAVTLTITDDDDPPTLSITSPRLDEGNTGSAPLSFGVMLNAASEKQITVAYAMGTGTATAGEDYTALADGTLTFAPGTVSLSLAVSIIGDETDEPHETVVITLSSLVNATFTGDATTLTGTGRIIDDDPAVATLVLSSESISENGGIATVTATLSNPENAAVTITISATPKDHAVMEDFTLSSARTLTIAADSLTSTGLVTIEAEDDTLDAENKTVTVSGTVTEGNNATAPDAMTLTITDDDDPPTLSITSPSAAEGNTGSAPLSFRVTLSAASKKQITVAYADAGTGTATAGEDYTALAAGTLTFAPGTTSQTFAVSITGDETDEPDETVVITLSSLVNATFTGGGTTFDVAGTIADDDPALATLVLSSASISENNGITTVTATLSNPENAAVTITISATPEGHAVMEDFTLSSAKTLTIAANGTTSTGLVTITANDNDVRAATKSVTVSGTADDTPDVVAPPDPVTLMITDDESPQVTLVLSPAAISENGGVSTVTATLSTPEGAAVTITVSATPEGHAVMEDFTLSTEKTLTIAADSLTSTGLVTIRANDNNARAATKSVTVSGTADDTPDVVAPPDPVTLMITDDESPQVTLVLSPAAISENNGITTVTATLSTPEGAAVTITISATPEGHAVRDDFTLSAETTLTIAADSLTSTGLVTIRANDNNARAATKSVTVSGTADDTPDVVAPPAPVTLTITDDDDPVSIPDAGLRAVIEDSLNKAIGEPITRAEMATLTRLIAPNKNISDLTGLEFATGLDTLNLADNNIADIQPLVDNAGLGTGVAIDLRGNPLSDPSRDVHVPALEARGVAVQVSPATNLDIDNDGTADLTDAIMVILYLFALRNDGITSYIFFSDQATRTDPQEVTAYIKTLIDTGRIDIDADGTVDLTDIIMVILYLFALRNEGITSYIFFSDQATRTDPQEITAYIASLLP